jgi:signal transduction histidine kinase
MAALITHLRNGTVVQDFSNIRFYRCLAVKFYTRSIIMPTPAFSTEPLTEADYICVAGDLLSRMMSKLQSLEANNQRLALAMTTAGHDLRQRLHLLLGTVELLTSSAERSRSMDLGQRAKTVIFRLAGELEQLALQAERDHNRAPTAAYCFVISNLLGQLKSDWECEAAAKYLDFRVGPADYLVESDQRHLAVIMNNLVGNAVRHTKQGCVTVSSTIDGAFVVLSVTDTGPGISDEDIRRSFSFSSRLRGFNEGMGLGLSIARKTAEMLGHEFAVSTGKNGGTCVRLYVPLAKSCAYSGLPSPIDTFVQYSRVQDSGQID